MNYFRKVVFSAIITAFGFAPLALADKLDAAFVENYYYDAANEQFVTQESIDAQAATPFAIPQEAYWTKERMINAMPYPMPKMEGEPMDANFQSLNSGLSKGQVSEGSLSLADKLNKKKSLTALNEEKNAVAIAGGSISALAYPPAHTTFYVPSSKYTTYPYKTVGKVFFSSGGYNYVCSGSSIGGRAVLTAGHCVSNGSGSWYTNWRFVPAYQNGSAPYGTWSAFWKTSFDSWHNGGNFCRDVGFAAVSDISGLTLSQTVGNLGFAWNESYSLNWSMFGYPAASPYDGSVMVQTDAAFSKSDSPYSCSPSTVGIGTNQTGGTSGGPRIYSFVENSQTGNNYANGVNSYVYTAKPLELFSPYFDSSVNNMKNTAIAK